MSAPPLFRFVDERRVSVVRDAAAVRQVLDADPVGSCMVASRVAEHGVDPGAIGGELWSRGSATESLCYAGANLIPLRVSQPTCTPSPTRRSAGPGAARRLSDTPSWCCRCGAAWNTPGAPP